MTQARGVPSAPAASPGRTRALQLLGVEFDALDRADLLRIVQRAVEQNDACTIGGHNLHSVYLYHEDAKMRRFYQEASWVFMDGMPPLWWGRALGLPVERRFRNTPVDWIPAALEQASRRGWRVFFLGSSETVAEQIRRLLPGRFPGLIVGSRSGYFDMRAGSADAEGVVAEIRSFNPQILCVGMGMPRQEHWVVDFAARVPANVIVTTGALSELLVGALPTPPRWVGAAGLEWLYRLLSSPRRVARRYLVEPWSLVPKMVADVRSRARGRP